MRGLIVVFIGILLVFALVVIAPQYFKGSSFEDEILDTKKILAEIGQQKLNNSKPGSGDTAKTEEKIVIGARQLNQLYQESTSHEMTEFFKQMEKAVNGESRGQMPDLTALTKFARLVDKFENTVRKARGPQSEFIQTALGQVKKTRARGLKTVINPNKPNHSLHLELLFDAAHFDDTMDAKSSTNAAKQLAAAECELLKREFAQKCEYSRHYFDRFVLHGGEKIVYFGIRIRFSQKDGIGNAPTLNEGEYLEFKKKDSDLIENNTHRYWVNDPKRMAAYRYKTYQQIAKRCESLRRIWGNCSITHIIAGAERRLFRIESLYFTSNVKFGIVHHAG